MSKKEIEKAKEELNNYIIIINKTKDTENEWHGYYNNELHELKRDIETLLQYTEQLESKVQAQEMEHKYDVNMINEVKGEAVELYNKIEKLNKMINEMSKELNGLVIWNENPDKTIILRDAEQVKQYFEKKVEGK